MTDFFEIDFLDVKSPKSGDAICIRYSIDEETYIHVVDGGFQATGDHVVEHINAHYDLPEFIDHVVATHPDGDHAGGLRTVLETYDIGMLWLHRPWLYADELVHRFLRFSSSDNLARRLKEIYPNLAALEEIALERGIPMAEPFQGEQIGVFTVLSPTYDQLLDLVVASEKTPESTSEEIAETLGLAALAKKVANFIAAAWGTEVFSDEETSAENEMSVVQATIICGKSIVLTADAGRQALGTAADAAYLAGLDLPGVDRFQVPHHGSRRNVSSDLLDRWLGERMIFGPSEGEGTFSACISSAKEDDHHPRRAVVRACIHRGAKVFTTEGADLRSSKNAPNRDGWSSAKPLAYPEDQETD